MKSLCTFVLIFAVAAPASATTLLFDFGRTDKQSPSAPNVPTWNNAVPATSDLFAVYEDGGSILPGVTFQITDEFFTAGEPSELGSESPAGDASGFPVSATDDYFFGHTGGFAGQPDNPFGEFKLSGLDASKTYNFTFFSARNGVGDVRQTQFDLTGANSGSGLSATSNNDSEVVRINGISPDGNNEIFVGVQKGPSNDNGNGFFYVNLMQVDVIPEPSSAMLLALSVALPALWRRSHRNS